MPDARPSKYRGCLIVRILPSIIIILGIVVPPVIAHAIAGWSGIVGLYLAAFAWIAWLAWGAPLDEMFPDSPPPGRSEDRTVSGESEINATAAHRGER